MGLLLSSCRSSGATSSGLTRYSLLVTRCYYCCNCSVTTRPVLPLDHLPQLAHRRAVVHTVAPVGTFHIGWCLAWHWGWYPGTKGTSGTTIFVTTINPLTIYGSLLCVQLSLNFTTKAFGAKIAVKLHHHLYSLSLHTQGVTAPEVYHRLKQS